MTASKTEREGKGYREVRIEPELLDLLTEAFKQAEAGAEYVVTRYRSSNRNLRSQLERIARCGGVDLWCKPFVNLRSSCATDWSERFPIKTVTSWLGHSPEICLRHYLQVPERHFYDGSGAVLRGKQAGQNPGQLGGKMRGRRARAKLHGGAGLAG